MARTLDVYILRNLVGQLTQDDHGDLSFKYDADWLDRPAAAALSHSLPLRSEPFSRNRCRGYFAGILPEADKRRIIAKNLGISANNDFAMLERIGGECAGAVTFVPVGEELPENDDGYRPLSEFELADILRSLPNRPLMAGEQGVRLSLAGAQDKLPVRIDGDQVFLPLGLAPSTHLLKPAIQQFANIVTNEAFCMEFLAIKRYDRNMTETGKPIRLHQEDFCQALGISPEQKYQNEGGPSLVQCMQLLRETSAVPAIDLQSLFECIIFNFLIGNNDAHGKNFSFLHRPAELGGTRLAPFYDLVSTVYYPDLSHKMAMKLGGEYDPDKVVARRFDHFAEDAGLGKAWLKRRVKELTEALISTLATMPIDNQVARDIAKLIRGRCEKTLVRLKS